MTSGSLPALGCAAAACVLAVFEALGYGGFLLGDDRQVLACNGVAANVRMGRNRNRHAVRIASRGAMPSRSATIAKLTSIIPFFLDCL